MIYQFDEFSLDSQEFHLTQSGTEIPLEPRVFDVLVYLIDHRERIVSKEELIKALWDDRVITDSALNTCIRSIRRALGDDRSQQKYIRTFPKRGFQFVASIQLEKQIPESGFSSATESPNRTMPGKYRTPLFAGALIVLGLATVFVYQLYFSTPQHSYPDRPSIAVLEFDHSFKNDQQRFFTEGLAEELVSSLSRYRELFVISRNSSKLFNSQETGVSDIGQQLGARYLVDGSVRYDNDNIHVATRLIDSASGQQIWSTKFSRNQQSIFALQNELAYLIAGQVVPELVRIDSEKSSKVPPNALDAWTLYHKARIKQTVYQQDMQSEAIEYANLALAQDPDLAAAHGVIARARGTQFFFQWTENPEQTLEEAISHAQKAISLDKNDPGAYAALGYVYRYTGDETSSIANLERASLLNPSDATIKLEFAHTLDWFRRQQEALPVINEALALSPRDPRLESMYFYKAHILFHLNRYQDSLDTTNDMSGTITTDTWRVFYHLIRAANYAQLDKAAEAGKHVQSALKLNPNLTLTAMRKRFEGSKNHPDNRKFWLDSLEKAGVPI